MPQATLDDLLPANISVARSIERLWHVTSPALRAAVVGTGVVIPHRVERFLARAKGHLTWKKQMGQDIGRYFPVCGIRAWD